jgi:hypothetical protein
VVDLHWTLAQCRLQAGNSAESLDALHRARPLVLTARLLSNLHEVEKAGDTASGALTALLLGLIAKECAA